MTAVQGDPVPRPRRAAWRGVLVLIGVVFPALWLALPHLAERVVYRLAARAGLEQAQFSVGRVGLFASEMAEARFTVVVGGSRWEVELHDLRTEYSPAALAESRVTVARVSLTGRIAGGDTAGGGGAVVLPLRQLEVRQLALVLESPWGPLRFTGAAQLTVQPEGVLEAVLQGDGQTLRFRLPATLDKAELELADAQGETVGRATLQSQPPMLTAQAEAAALVRWWRSSPLVPPAWREYAVGAEGLWHGLALGVTADRGADDAPLRFAVRLAHGSQALAQIQGTAAVDGPTAATVVAEFPLALLAERLAPLVPHLPQAGKLHGRAELTWQDGGLAGDAALDATGLTAPSPVTDLHLALEGLHLTAGAETRLSARRFVLAAATPQGAVAADGTLALARPAAGGLDARYRDGVQVIHGVVPPTWDQAGITVESPLQRRLATLDARWAPAPVEVRVQAEAEALEGWLRASPLLPAELRARLNAGPVVFGGTETLGSKVALHWQGTGEGAQARLTLAQGARTLVRAEARLPAAGVPTAQLWLDAPVRVWHGVAQRFLPLPARPWWPQAGELAGQAQLRWQDGSLRGSAELDATGLAVTVGRLQAQDARLTLREVDLAQRQGTLTLEVPVVRLGERLEAHALAVGGRYAAEEVRLAQASAEIFGGRVAVVPTRFDPRRRPLPLRLRVEAVDLAQLLLALEEQGVSGSGRLSGELPVALTAEGFEVAEGALHGIEAGVLRYQGPASDSENIAFQALRNLAYHTLAARVDYRPSGDYRLGLRLEGSNPDLLGGKPIAFNLNVTGRLDELLREWLLTGEGSEAILRRALEQPAAP